MTLLKNLAVGLFSSFLFLALTVFGFAFTLKSTALNPSFVKTEVSRLPIASIFKDLVQTQNPSDFPDLDKQINQAVAKLEPDIKKQTSAAVDSVYDYLLGKKPKPELVLTIRRTFLSTDFVTKVVNSVDMAPLLAPPISQQLAEAIPVPVPKLETYVTQALTAAEPSLKQQLITASGPVSDYLLGTSKSLNVTISLKEPLASLKGVLRQAFINSPPAGVTIGGIPLTAIPQDLRGAAFDTFYPTIAGAIPADFTIDENMIPPDVPEQLRQNIAGVEDSLAQARKYVNQFQQYYSLLIAFMALMVLGIILLLRDVKAITRRLGVPLLTSGAIDYAFILVGKYFATPDKLNLSGVPASLQTWLFQLSDDLLKPAQTFSLAILIIGAVLVVVSFVYGRKQT